MVISPQHWHFVAKYCKPGIIQKTLVDSCKVYSRLILVLLRLILEGYKILMNQWGFFPLGIS